MSNDPGASKVTVRQVFISHVSDDPDWPPDQIEAVADAIRDAGIAVRMDLWSQPEGARFPSIPAWIAWMDDTLRRADRIVCLVSPLYKKLWTRRQEDTVAGLALQAIWLAGCVNQDRSDGSNRLVTIRQKEPYSSSVPNDLVDCLAFHWPTGRAELIARLLGKEDPWHVKEALRIVEDAMSAIPRSAEKLSSGTLHLLSELDPGGTSADVAAPDVPIGPEQDAAGPPVFDDSGETSIVVEAQAISHASVSTPRIEIVAAPEVVQRRELHRASTDNSGRWPPEDAWRAPVGDFPPSWASAWGDDPYGLWADLTVNGATQRMRWIEPSGPEGFWMGSTKQERDAIQDNAVRHWAIQSEHLPITALVEQGFWLADTPCTQAFWQAVTSNNPSNFDMVHEASQHPVVNVSRDDVKDQFIAQFAQTPEWRTGHGLCLPSEVEWEYAARAGTRTAYWWGETWADTFGNAGGNIGATTAVKHHPANPWGLYDIHGNVWEWCSDPWQLQRDAPEARPEEAARAVRGGSWFSPPDFARAAFRIRRPRRGVSRDQGFRFALRSPAGPEAR